MDIRTMTNYAIGFLISLFIFPILLVTGIELVTYDQTFYAGQYKRLNTSEEIGMTSEELIRVTKELTDYIRGRLDTMDQIEADINGVTRPVFNEREKEHMVDVRALFRFASNVRNISLLSLICLFIILFYLSNKKPWKYFSAAYLVTAASLLLILIAAVPIVKSNFTYYWDQFHYLFFDNDLWILNPETDIMIQMVPEPFFYSAVFRVLAYFGSGCFAIGLASFLILRAARKRNRNLISEEVK